MTKPVAVLCWSVALLGCGLALADAAAVLAEGGSSPIKGDDLVAAINAAEPGDVVIVPPGKYRGGTIIRDGVTVRATPEPGAVVTGGVNLRANDVVLEGLLWQDLNDQLLQVRGSRNVIRNCRFRRFGLSGPAKAIWIREDGSYNDTVIEGCLFEDWGGKTYHSSCVKIGQAGFGDAHSGTIVRNCILRRGAVGGNSPALQPFCPSLLEGNTIHDCEDGIEVKGSHITVRNNTVYRCLGGEAMSNRSGSHNLFEDNLLHDIPGYAWQIWTGEQNVWRNNVIYNCGRIAHIKGGNRPGQEARDILLINNTFVGNDRGISWDLKKHPPHGIRLLNNIFVGDGSSAIEPAGRDLLQEDHNLFFRFMPPSAPGSGSICGVDPLFRDMVAHDFRLRPGSPALDAGLAVLKGLPPCDRLGTSRRQGLGVDIGAFEMPAAR